MKILSSSTYDDLKKQIETAAEKEIDFNIKEKIFNNTLDEKNKEIEMLSSEREKAAEQSAKLLYDNNNLKKSLDQLKQKASSTENALKNLERQLRSAYASSGGLKRYNNILEKKLKKAEEKIENYKKDALENHRKLTAKEYDLRLKPSKRRK